MEDLYIQRVCLPGTLKKGSELESSEPGILAFF